MRLLHIIAAFADTPWALQLDTLQAMHDLLERAQHGRSTESEVSAAIMARGAREDRRTAAADGQRQGVAVIPVYGVLAHRAHQVLNICGPGGTSTELLDKAVRSAAADPDVRAIVLDVDSPGGSVAGVQELAATIMELRADKPIAAVANSTASSAAYWIAAAAHELYVIPSGEVGSIGVFGVHVDSTRADEMAGKSTTVISAGKYKTEGIGALTDDAREHLQTRVDAYYRQFVHDVARQRGVAVDAVRRGYGEGRSLGAKAALEAGMVDGIATLQQVVGKYGRRTLEDANRGRTVRGSAEGEIRKITSSVEIYRQKIRLAEAAMPPISSHEP